MVETAYNDWANASQRALLSQEFYGPEFKLFKDETITTLSAALAKHPEKKEVFLKHMNQAIEPIIAKGEAIFKTRYSCPIFNFLYTYIFSSKRCVQSQSVAPSYEWVFDPLQWKWTIWNDSESSSGSHPSSAYSWWSPYRNDMYLVRYTKRSKGKKFASTTLQNDFISFFYFITSRRISLKVSKAMWLKSARKNTAIWCWWRFSIRWMTLNS